MVSAITHYLLNFTCKHKSKCKVLISTAPGKKISKKDVCIHLFKLVSSALRKDCLVKTAKSMENFRKWTEMQKPLKRLVKYASAEY